jgi:hypothetical protein
MSPSVSTEVQGWLEALADPGTVLVLLLRALSAALCAAFGAWWVAGIREAPAPALVAFLAALVVGLVLLRVRGRA